MTAPDAKRAGRGRAAAVLLLLAGATALSALPVWLTTTGTNALAGTVPVRVTGMQVAPGIVAAAVAILAAVSAVALVGRAGRWVVALVVLACGALVVGSAVSVLADPAAAAAPIVATQTGVGHLAGPVDVTAWPAIAVAVGVLDVLAAAWLIVASRRWARPTRRYQADASADAPGPEKPADERADWDALSRGDDPS